MIQKIISGGQTGADQGALDAAIEFGIPYGGWIPKGRLTEDGTLQEMLKLKEMPTKSYNARTEQNVIDSDGTVIIHRDRLTGGSLYTGKMTKKHGKPCLNINLKDTSTFSAALEIARWARDNRIELLNVAGPRASKDPTIYATVKKIMTWVIHISIVKDNVQDVYDGKAHPNEKPPKTAEEVIDRIIESMSFRDKALVAKMDEDELHKLDLTLGRYISNRLDEWEIDDTLMDSFYGQSDGAFLTASVLKLLWEKLKFSHALRVIK
ncbi:MAG: putative molybdenum carrier protein [Deltaproteobacteria bacterium]|nr:putative molybdenum carrier protein [Deltaproteobacteria bacterium]